MLRVIQTHTHIHTRYRKQIEEEEADKHINIK